MHKIPTFCCFPLSGCSLRYPLGLELHWEWCFENKEIICIQTHSKQSIHEPPICWKVCVYWKAWWADLLSVDFLWFNLAFSRWCMESRGCQMAHISSEKIRLYTFHDCVGFSHCSKGSIKNACSQLFYINCCFFPMVQSTWSFLFTSTVLKKPHEQWTTLLLSILVV